MLEEFEASTSTRKTKTIYISTVISIAMVLLMVGLLGLLLVHARKISNYVKENVVVNLYVDETAKEADIFQLQKQLESNPQIKQAVYISKELAARKLQQDMGEDAIKFLGYNVLPSSIDVYFKADFATSANINKFQTDILKNPLVKEARYQEPMVGLMNKNMNSISLVILAFAGIFFVVSVAMINNTIRLAIYSQRFLIKSMQLVGATKGFIRWPFVGFALLHGLLGGLIAIILLITCLYFGYRQVPDLILLRNYYEFGIIFLALIGLGMFISGFSTFLAVNKFLRLKIYDLYR